MTRNETYARFSTRFVVHVFRRFVLRVVLKLFANAQQGRNSGESQALARELMCAAVHSRAAYGHAMAAGHLASLLDFALLQTVHQLRFDPVGGASSEANNQAVAALAGIPVEDIKLAEWHNSVMRPCHYLAVDRAHGCLVLSIRCHSDRQAVVQIKCLP